MALDMSKYTVKTAKPMPVIFIFSKIKADKSARKPHKHAELHGFKQWFVGQQELTFRNSQPKLENQAV